MEHLFNFTSVYALVSSSDNSLGADAGVFGTVPVDGSNSSTIHKALKQDRLTVHNIVLRNIADGSDAFTYVKPHLKKDNGRVDIKALRDQYENPAMQEQYINKAKQTLETLTYCNERALKFEKFVAKFVKAVDELGKRNRGMHNADIVDMIWQKMTNWAQTHSVVGKQGTAYCSN
jgi:hypothetical protein